MKYIKFVKIAASMLESESFGHFRASFPDVDDKVLDAVWKLKDNPVLGISEVANSTVSEISRCYMLPLRSLQNWSSGERQCPNYVWILLAYAVFSDLNIWTSGSGQIREETMDNDSVFDIRPYLAAANESHKNPTKK